MAAHGLEARGDAGTEHLDLDPEPRSVRAARRWVQDRLAGTATVDDEGMAVLLLLTSELVTNAVLHARTDVSVGLTPLVDGVLVTVADGNLLLPEQQPYSGTRPSGRGITLLHELAERWGVHRDDDGKAVWFVLPQHADAGRVGAAAGAAPLVTWEEARP